MHIDIPLNHPTGHQDGVSSSRPICHRFFSFCALPSISSLYSDRNLRVPRQGGVDPLCVAVSRVRYVSAGWTTGSCVVLVQAFWSFENVIDNALKWLCGSVERTGIDVCVGGRQEWVGVYGSRGPDDICVLRSG